MEPAGTVTRELRRLAEVGLLERESRGNQVVYRANRGSPVFEEVAGILRKTSGLADELARALAPFSDGIRVAFVFGSMAGGSQQVGSDVDVIVMLADVGLNASGYRARSSVPGAPSHCDRALGVTFGVALARYPSLSVRAPAREL